MSLVILLDNFGNLIWIDSKFTKMPKNCSFVAAYTVGCSI